MTTISFPLFSGLLRNLQTRPEGRAAGDAGQDPLLAGETARGIPRLLMADTDHLVDDPPVERRRG